MLFVRTEQRPFRPEPEYLFIETINRTVFARWLTEVPEEFELVIDTEGRAQANEKGALLWASEHDRLVLFGLLGRACAWLPPERARELRQEWKAAQP